MYHIIQQTFRKLHDVILETTSDDLHVSVANMVNRFVFERINDLMNKICNPTVNALELRLLCIKRSRCDPVALDWLLKVNYTYEYKCYPCKHMIMLMISAWVACFKEPLTHNGLYMAHHDQCFHSPPSSAPPLVPHICVCESGQHWFR